MNKQLILLPAALAALLSSGCEYDDYDDGDYQTRRVTVTTTAYPDEYTPYYIYDNRRYYRSGRRYVYYVERRPYYVTGLPTGARYVTPVRREVRVYETRHPDDPVNSPDWPR